MIARVTAPSGVRLWLATGTAHFATNPDTHCCAEINLGRMKLGHPDRRYPLAELHVEYCERHR
ncbi:hypothetical protein KZZ52_32195 [Dactylosporangium sp. AC04546]|uniref:hypothetical protein n=1 Tax=Dactylosporangium sp. AC04546 TaxID=2862460 RepID=UPI001EE0218A|nr:hypothetical protein [Dactylosporangium sp. AC04546]WVK78652.1 hypothetical protein KZZ52_32195 [Dactylosporangium sp. AC04546]